MTHAERYARACRLYPEVAALRSGGATYEKIGRDLGISPSWACQLLARGPGQYHSPAERFWSHVDKSSADGCWGWAASVCRDGYGHFSVGGRYVRAHRFAYELLVGPIPDGLVIDHLCRNPSCVNPAHMEPVTPAENTRRGCSQSGINARRTHCKHGHEFDEENTYVDSKGQRNCRECNRIKMRRRSRAARALAAPALRLVEPEPERPAAPVMPLVAPERRKRP